MFFISILLHNKYSCLHLLFFSCLVYIIYFSHLFYTSCIVYFTHFSHFQSSCTFHMYLCTYTVHVLFVTYTLHEHYYASIWNRSWPLRLQTPCFCHLTTMAIADSSSFFTLPNPFFRPTTKLKDLQPPAGTDPGHMTSNTLSLPLDHHGNC